jgi:hypothetical protein
MQAMVREDCRFMSITAGGGQEFAHNEWRTVREGTEDEIRANDFLMVREMEMVEPETEEEVELLEQINLHDLPYNELLEMARSQGRLPDSKNRPSKTKLIELLMAGAKDAADVQS